MTDLFTFSYVVVEQQFKDRQGNPVISFYPFWITAAEDKPIQVLRSSTPAIVVKLYSGNRYPTSDYRDTLEQRVKQDIEHCTGYDDSVASQMRDTKWHLVS